MLTLATDSYNIFATTCDEKQVESLTFSKKSIFKHTLYLSVFTRAIYKKRIKIWHFRSLTLTTRLPQVLQHPWRVAMRLSSAAAADWLRQGPSLPLH